MNPFTKHPSETKNPQSYWKHGTFAFVNSLILIWAGIIGIIHSIFPFLFPFFTSTIVIRSFNKLVYSKLHIGEINRELPKDFINPKYKD